MSLICGGIVPHAPLLLKWVSGDEVSGRAAAVKEAFSSFRADGPWDLGAADVLVIASPHGQSTGIHGVIDGALTGFGEGLPGLEAPGDEEAAALMASISGLPLARGFVDHGTIVPLLLLAGEPALDADVVEVESPVRFPRVVACIQGERDDPFAFARAVAEATRQLAKERNVAFLASAHTSAGLTQRAPLTELPGGRHLDDQVLAALGHDVGDLSRIPDDDWAAAGSCGTGPLLALGELFAGRSARTVVYEAPYGVGYLVAGVGGR